MLHNDSTPSASNNTKLEETLQEQKFYSTKEFAKLIGKNEKTIRRWNQSGKFNPAKIDDNGYFYYSGEQVRTSLRKVRTFCPKNGEKCPIFCYITGCQYAFREIVRK